MSKSLDCIFRPKSIAVIGASRKKGSIGGEILRNLFRFEFNGMIFPINPQAQVIHSTKCYPSVLDVPDDIDLAIIVVPKEKVLQVIDECGAKGVKGIVVISAGFREVGGQGIELEKQLVEKIKKYGMRMVGPNCMGVINTESRYSMDATFASTLPLPGKTGFVSQSGALGAAILDHAREINLGLSMFISVGNKADISGNDLLEYWADDDQTQLILMYLESFGNPRKFTQLARDIVKKKPIIAVKAGRTRAGARAASSHTGALAGLDLATDALFEQCGVLRVNSVEELFDLAQAFANQPVPAGNRVAIITNAGGPGIMATDACISHGLEIPQLSAQTIKKLRTFSSTEASFSNPMDMVASAGGEAYRKTLEVILEDENIDAAIVIFVPPITINPIEVTNAIIAVSQTRKDKPILCCFMGKADQYSGISELRKNNLPVYLYPESAALALSAMVKYRTIKERTVGVIRSFDVDKEKASAIFQKAQNEGRQRLTYTEMIEVMTSYGISFPAFELVNNVEEALEVAERVNYPVVLKMVSSEVIHKSDIGGVIIDVRNEVELIKGYQEITKKTKKLKKGEVGEYQILIQEMVKGGKETIIGVAQDPSFGPLIMFGLGGIYVETFKDVNFRIHPITDKEALSMVESLKSISLLKGVRGEPPVNMDAIVETLQRVSQLITDFSIIQELDLNPFIVFPEKAKCKAVDGRISIKIV